MISSPTFQTLCCELVEDHYGDFYRSIFEALVSGGRLTASQVAQKCHLPLRQARAGLASLIQLRLINHYTAKDALTIYSTNLSTAYDIIRTGRLIGLAQAKHGRTASKLVRLACELGFATVNELTSRLMEEDDGVDFESESELERLTQDLVDDHVLIMRRRVHAQEVHDAKKEIELNITTPAALARLTGTKAKLEHHEAVESRYRQAVDTGFPEHGRTNTGFVSRKKTDANGTLTNGHLSSSSILLQPNHYKVVTASQIDGTYESALRMYGKRTATVLSSAIRQVANPDTWSRYGGDYCHQLDMYKLQHDTKATLQVGPALSLPNGSSRTNGHSHEVYQEEDEIIHVHDIERELKLLQEGPLDFIRQSASAWEIDKVVSDSWTRQEEILRAMDSRLDAPGPRILRILVDKGKLEEKTLQEIGLLGAKELRQSLSKLKQMGYLELQEIPRDPHRLPNKTVFLWYHDTVRVAKLVLEAAYASMLHLVQMLRLERKTLAGTMEKIAREDVRGKEEEMLPPGEYVILQRFRRLELWTWNEIHRLDSTVAVLRDL